VNLYDAGIRGVFCGGTTMTPQDVRFIVEEVLEGRIGFYPTYGNTLMGLAASVPLCRRTTSASPTTRRSRVPCCVW
jgi:hypothetical protein